MFNALSLTFRSDEATAEMEKMASTANPDEINLEDDD